MNISINYPTDIKILLLFISSLFMLLPGCASWQVPEDYSAEPLRARAVNATVREVQLSAAVLSTEDSQRIFGADINTTGVQPVWIEVENHSSHTLWLLRSGTDPDYYSPLEVAWSVHTPFAGKNNAAIDDHLKNLSFEGSVRPGETRSGYIFVNPGQHTRVLNVDLLGQRSLFPFTLFLPVPGSQSKNINTLKAGYAGIQVVDYQDAGAFRMALEQLSCCAMNNKAAGEPINMVLVGKMTDIAASLVRRGFRRKVNTSDSAQQLFGRSPDHVVRKAGQGGTPSNWIRTWLAPLRYQGQPVFLVQAGRPVGGRFASIEDDKRVLHPNIDEARNLFIQDMLYSGGLAKLGFVKGVSKVDKDHAEQWQANGYYTDGLRAVLFFVTRPLTLSEVEILDWVPMLEQRETEASAKQSNTGK
jgi:hypothetical protein